MTSAVSFLPVRLKYIRLVIPVYKIKCIIPVPIRVHFSHLCLSLKMCHTCDYYMSVPPQVKKELSTPSKLQVHCNLCKLVAVITIKIYTMYTVEIQFYCTTIAYHLGLIAVSGGY